MLPKHFPLDMLNDTDAADDFLAKDNCPTDDFADDIFEDVDLTDGDLADVDLADVDLTDVDLADVDDLATDDLEDDDLEDDALKNDDLPYDVLVKAVLDAKNFDVVDMFDALCDTGFTTAATGSTLTGFSCVNGVKSHSSSLSDQLRQSSGPRVRFEPWSGGSSPDRF